MPAKHHITTFTGRAFNLASPTPDMICIEDIAHHLAMVCRWAGATTTFFSVAQHSVLVSKIAPPELQRWALLHDAAEAYIGDVTRPLKALLRTCESGAHDARCPLDIIEESILETVASVFHLAWPEPSELKAYDDAIQKLEARIYVRHDGDLHARTGEISVLPDLTDEQRIPTPYLAPLAPEAAELMFLARFRKLFLDDDGL